MWNRLIRSVLKTPFKPGAFKVDRKEIPYMRLKIPIEMDNMFAFLEAQTLYPKIYWENPKDGIVAGIGKALELDHVPVFGSRKGPRFYGGLDFMKRRRGIWKNYPKKIYFLPLVEIEKKGDKTFLCVNRIEDRLTLDLQEETQLKGLGEVVSRLDAPSFSKWEGNVNEILQGIRCNDYAKVVLARCTELKFKGSLSPYSILEKLIGNSRFCFQFSPEIAFIGTSPETLYRRNERDVESSAVAGTVCRGSTKQDDERLKRILLADAKQQCEVEIVKNRIFRILSLLCDALEVGDQRVLKTPTLQHLYYPFRGILKDFIKDTSLIEALHPTPAVGGYPIKEALNQIKRKEPFDRGWYSAPVGWISPSEAHHLVGIRSALIQQNITYLFAGTGIVKGSIPSKEWDELEQKIAPYLKVFYAQ